MPSSLMEFLFPEYRLDWFGAGPSSPNKTGALLAIVFIAAWWPALRFRWGYWLSLPVAFVAAGILLQTESRGAIMGAVSGLLVLVVGGFFTKTRVDRFPLCHSASEDTVKTLKERLKRNAFMLRALSLVVALCLLVFYSHQLGVNDRMTAMTSGEDGSTNVRFALYSAGLQMIADAPSGWGHGQAGNAYGQWYQEVGDSRSYLSLVNSHLTWMTDYGMLFQFVYIAGWVLVLLLCWPLGPMRYREDAIGMASLQEIEWSDVSIERSSERTGALSLRLIAFATWVVLGLCGVFSSVLTLVWLWVIPCSLLLLCLFQRVRSNDWPSVRQAQVACLAVILGFFGLQAVAHAFAWGNQIAVDHELIELGEMPKTVAIVQPDRQILGDKFGHTIREYLEDTGGMTVLRDDSAQVDLSQFETLVFSGSLPQMDLSEHTGSLVWLNPPANVEDATLEVLRERLLTIVVGSLGDWRRVRLWQSLADENLKWDLIELRGVADFIPNWPKYIKEGEDE
ncbi:O-antigen ligase family protein [Coraliomargarita sp. SDUM461004]|uniref:O-antigen ligase family protein n=2 Tax=Thalassobacterium sedimentorum TaxID=3041258 RepID=A0ABU1AN82_9BACT|nr:O-antigen ligase family protein [Coraliomargarita sp. SDUM461004]